MSDDARIRLPLSDRMWSYARGRHGLENYTQSAIEYYAEDARVLEEQLQAARKLANTRLHPLTCGECGAEFREPFCPLHRQQAPTPATQRPESREVAEQLLDGWKDLDCESELDAIAQALDTAWKGGMEQAAEIASHSGCSSCGETIAAAIRAAKEQPR